MSEFEVTSAGVYDMPADVYHADPVPGGSLSSSGAKNLLAPSCPALFKHERDHGGRVSRAFDYGSAAHMLVLGAGPTIHVIEAGSYRTKAAQEERDWARAEGRIPLLQYEYDNVVAMADALRAHPYAGHLFSRQRYEAGELIPQSGKAEQSLFWMDQMSGVVRRCRVDWLPESPPSGQRMIMPEYKTCVSAHPDAISKAVYDYGYHMQAAWNTAGVKSLGLADEVEMVFVFQEKTAPYLVTVVQLDANALRIGRSRNRHAINVFKHCTDTGQWPGYSDEVQIVSLPVWAETREMKEMA